MRREQGMEMERTEWRKKRQVNIDAFHPGHSNSKCCTVGNWTCFSFLKKKTETTQHLEECSRRGMRILLWSNVSNAAMKSVRIRIVKSRETVFDYKSPTRIFLCPMPKFSLSTISTQGLNMMVKCRKISSSEYTTAVWDGRQTSIPCMNSRMN